MSQPATSSPKASAVRINRWVLRFARNWLRIFLTGLGIFVALPFVAPTLMRLGAEGPANAIYSMYRPFCHQFAFRSIFLYGEQLFYPRYNTGSSLTPFETYVQGLPDFAPDRVLPWPFGTVGDVYAFTPGFQGAAQGFVGSPQMGYKMTLCARDAASWSALFIGGVIFSLSRVRRRLRPAPVWLYIILGLAPIGLDGFSQLLGYPPFNLWPPRETLPEFRVLTGLTFGFMNAWLGLPYFELSMRETRQQIEAKFARAGVPLR